MVKQFTRLNINNASVLLQNTANTISLAKDKLNKIIENAEKRESTTGNTLIPLNEIFILIVEARNQASLFAAVHTDKAIRKAAEKCVEKLSDFSSKLYLRRDLYEAIKSVNESNLDGSTKRFRKKELQDFELSGVNKSQNIRKEIIKLINKATKLGQLFDRNIKDDVRHIDLPVIELSGLPDDYIKSHKLNKKGLIRVTTQYPDYFPFMKYAENSEARRKLNFVSLNRGWPKNEKILKELLITRDRIAKLLGFADFANYATVDKMTGSAKSVHKFLDQVAELVKNPAKRDFDILLKRKQKDIPNAKTLNLWEIAYYENIVSKEQIGFNSQELRNYLLFQNVKKGVLNITEKLFGLSYKRVKSAVWYKEVETYDVFQNKKIIGRFYLDLHPRDGKYGHAACFDIRPGITDIQLPEAALICNFSKELLSHDEVTTFLHEFGHLIHFILSGNQKWERFNGFGAEWDFVEAPSQMLEAWAYDFGTLKGFARHYKSNKPIPKTLITQMQKADKFARGIWMQRQNSFAKLSLRYHQEKNLKKANLSNILNSVQKKYGGVVYPKNTHFYANFGHLNSYSAIYYTYIWSHAIAQNILYPFKTRGMYNKKITKKYVNEILIPGGSKDAQILIHNFLGKDWNMIPFKKWLAE